MLIGGYFMFRKFLKRLPREDGKSVMDWELYYIEKTKHLWGQKEKDLLEDLVSPVPKMFRNAAKQKIASKIGQLVLEEQKEKIDEDTVIRGYILATPKQDHKFLRKKLKEKNIDVTQYEHLFL